MKEVYIYPICLEILRDYKKELPQLAGQYIKQYTGSLIGIALEKKSQGSSGFVSVQWLRRSKKEFPIFFHLVFSVPLTFSGLQCVNIQDENSQIQHLVIYH